MTGRKPRAAFLQDGLFIPDPQPGHSLDKTKPHPNTDFHRSWNWWSHFFFFIFLILHKFTCDKDLAVYLAFLMAKGSVGTLSCLTYPTKTFFEKWSQSTKLSSQFSSVLFLLRHTSAGARVWGKGTAKSQQFGGVSFPCLLHSVCEEVQSQRKERLAWLQLTALCCTCLTNGG